MNIVTGQGEMPSDKESRFRLGIGTKFFPVGVKARLGGDLRNLFQWKVSLHATQRLELDDL